jgi:hypothetical protein
MRRALQEYERILSNALADQAGIQAQDAAHA